jgi:hypothetical protein
VIEKKVTVSTLVAALVTIGVWLLRTFAGIDIPAEVTAAIITVVVALAGYLAPHTVRTGLPGQAAAEPTPAPETTTG